MLKHNETIVVIELGDNKIKEIPKKCVRKFLLTSHFRIFFRFFIHLKSYLIYDNYLNNFNWSEHVEPGTSLQSISIKMFLQCTARNIRKWKKYINNF